jgi:peroxiredoxin
MIEEIKVGPTEGRGRGGKDAEFAGLGLAVASLVLGILSVSLSLMMIGGACGLVGLGLAIVHLNKRYILRSMAWWGLGLSVAGLLFTVVFAIYFVSGVLEVRRTMAALEEQSFEEWIGTEAPDFTLTDLEGNTVVLSGLKGRRVILDFWATWCPPCRKEIPHFVKLRNEYDANDVFIMGISGEDEKTIRPFGKQHRINYPLGVEKDMPSPYSDITSIPTTFFVDRDGIIRYVAEGYHDFKELNGFLAGLDRKADPNK